MTIITRALIGASLAALAVFPASAENATPAMSSAEDARSSTPSDTEQTITVTAQKIAAQSVRDAARAPGGADVVGAEEYQDKLAANLRDALAFSPGVYAQPRYGQEVRISIRGSGIGRGAHLRGITLLQDGVPINLADGAGDFLELDPLLLERIAVLRGANAMSIGAASLGGAIDGITPTGRSAPGVRLRIDGGAFDTLREIATVGLATDRGDALLALSGETSNGDREHADRHGLRLNGNVGVRLGEGGETRLYVAALRLRQRSPGFLTADTVTSRPRSASPAALANDQARNVDGLRLQSRTRLALGGGRLEFGGFVNAKTLDHPIFQTLDQKSTDGGGFARGEWTAGPVALVAGVIARTGETRARRFVNIGGRRGDITFRAVQQASTVDTYGEARWTPTPALTLIGGATWGVGTRDQTQLFPTRARGRVRYDTVSPRAGVLVDPRPGVQLYANYSRSHEMPPLAELAQVSTFVPLGIQRGWTAEAGARGNIGPARFDLSAYRTDLRGELLMFTINQSVPAATFNADRTRHQGIEAGLDLDIGRLVRLRQVYQLNDFRFRDDAQYGDNRLPVVPRHLYRAELRLGDERAHLSPSVEWVPQGAWSDYANTYRPDGYMLLGATAAVRLRPGLELFADARNLGAERAAGDVAAVTRWTPASAIFFPVERRQFYAGVRARL